MFISCHYIIFHSLRLLVNILECILLSIHQCMWVSECVYALWWIKIYNIFCHYVPLVHPNTVEHLVNRENVFTFTKMNRKHKDEVEKVCVSVHTYNWARQQPHSCFKWEWVEAASNAHGVVQVRQGRMERKNLCRWSLHYISCNLRFEASDGREIFFVFNVCLMVRTKKKYWYHSLWLCMISEIYAAVQTFDVPLPLSFTSWVEFHPHTPPLSISHIWFCMCVYIRMVSIQTVCTRTEKERREKTSDRISGRRNLLVLGLTTFNLKTKMPYYPFADCVFLSLSGSTEIDTFTRHTYDDTRTCTQIELMMLFAMFYFGFFSRPKLNALDL